MFKRGLDKPGEFSEFKLQDIDVEDNPDAIYTKRIKTDVKPMNKLGEREKIEVSIREFEKVDGGFFSSAFVYFLIKVEGEEQPVKRKIGDFQWLRECLVKEFPVSYVPPLAFLENRPTDLAYIAHQIFVLSEFITEVVANSELKRSEYLDAFLLIPDHAQFLEAKKQLEASLPQRKDFKILTSRKTLEQNPAQAFSFEKLQTTNKHVDLKISPSLTEFFEIYTQMGDQTRRHMNRLRELSQELLESLKSTERIYKEMGSIGAQLHQANVEFNQESPHAENEVNERIFFTLQNVFILLGNTCKREGETVRTQLIHNFSQWERELSSLEDIVKTRNHLATEYRAMKTELADKKSRILANPMLRDKSEVDPIALKYVSLTREHPEFQTHLERLILPEQTRLARKYADIYAFANNWVFEQILSFNYRRNLREVEVLIKYRDEMTDINTQRQIIIEQLSGHLADCISKQEYLKKTVPVF